MGSTNFFSKLASVDPLAQALNLPGAHKYAQAEAQDEAGKAGASGGPYTGVTPTLAGANAGYAAGGPGATVGWSQYVPRQPSGLFGDAQRAANVSGNLTPQPWATGTLKPFTQANPTAGTQNTFVQGSQTVNPYVTAARGAAAQQPQQQWGS